MSTILRIAIFITAAAFASCNSTQNESAAPTTLLFKNANLISGDGSAPQPNTDLLVQGDTIAAIGQHLQHEGATTVDLTGKTIMPAIISDHVHIGVLKGTNNSAANYTRQNVLDQLKKYADFGVLNVQVMGTDRPVLFENGFYDSIRAGSLPGSRMLSAGFGFNTPQPNIDPNNFMSLLYRPSTAAQIPAEMDSLVTLNIKIVKMWVDDFAGTAPKMDSTIYRSIINEAHKRNIRVAAHLYYLADARKLVNDGVDIIAHSIRDSVVDDAFLQTMKAKNVVYVPTLSLDEFSFIYSREPEWINDPFFKSSLEPGVYEMITAEKYKTEQKNSPVLARNMNGFKIAMANLKKIFDAGILVGLGTDSGAMPIRAQGFSEHLEMQLMTEAGLTPIQAITAATKNAAEVLKIDDRFGTLAQGKIADLLILNADPLADIKNTRKIESVYKAGKKVK